MNSQKKEHATNCVRMKMVQNSKYDRWYSQESVAALDP